VYEARAAAHTHLASSRREPHLGNPARLLCVANLYAPFVSRLRLLQHSQSMSMPCSGFLDPHFVLSLYCRRGLTRTSVHAPNHPAADFAESTLTLSTQFAAKGEDLCLVSELATDSNRVRGLIPQDAVELGFVLLHVRGQSSD